MKEENQVHVEIKSNGYPMSCVPPEITIDGKKIRSLKSIELRLAADECPTLLIEFAIPDVSFDGEAIVEQAK